MILKIPPKTDSVRDLVHYVLSKGSAIGGTFPRDVEPGEATAEFMSYGELNPRVEKLVTHLSLSLPPEENLSDGQWEEAAERLLHGLGYTDNAWLLVRHTDRPHEHVHIVVSRIRADGSSVSDAWERIRGQQIVREIERSFGLREVPSSELSSARELTRGELASALREGRPSARRELQELVRAAAQEARDFPGLAQLLEEQGVRTLIHRNRAGDLHGISFELDGVILSGSQLGRGYTLRRLQQDFGLAALDPVRERDFIDRRLAPAPASASKERQEVSPRAAILDPAEAVAATLRTCAGEASSFTDFVERASSEGIKARIYLKDAKPVAIGYSQGSLYFRAAALGPEFNLRGLHQHFALEFQTADIPVLQGRSIEIKTDRPPQDDTEQRQRLLALVREAAGRSAGDAHEFLDLLAADKIAVRVYFDPSGKPRRIAFRDEERYFDSRSLDRDLDLRRLRQSFGLNFEKDSLATQAVTASPRARLDEAAIAPEVAALADAAASDHPNLTVFTERLHQEGVELHFLKDAASGEIFGATYEHHGVFLGASSLGPDYSFRGLQDGLGVRIDEETDASTLERISKTLERKPADPRDPWDDVRARIDSAASESQDFSGFVTALGQQRVEVTFHVHEGELHSLTYHLNRRSFEDHALGPQFTPAGLAGTYRLEVDPATRETILASGVRWTEELHNQLRASRLLPPRELSEVRRELQRSPLEALRTAAHAQFILGAVADPRLALRWALLHHPAGRVANDALSFVGAFRHPANAAVFALRMISRASRHAAANLSPPPPAFEALARSIVLAYAKAARSDADSVSSYAARLKLAGVDISVQRAGRPTLVYSIGEHRVPEALLPENLRFRALVRQLKDHEPNAIAALERLAHGPRPEPSPGGDDTISRTSRIEPPASPAPGVASGAARDSAPDPAAPHLAQPAIDEPPRPPASGSISHAVEELHPGDGVDASRPLDRLDPAGMDSATGGPPIPGPGEGTREPVGFPSGELPTAPPAVDPKALKRQIEALGAPAYHLRAVTGEAPPTTLGRDLSPDEVLQRASAWSGPGSLEIRPAGDPSLQLIRGVEAHQLQAARLQGYEPALVLETSPGRFEVWLRHAAQDSPPPSEVLLFAQRAARLAYGQPVTAPEASVYGALSVGQAGQTPRLVGATGQVYPEARTLIPQLTHHANAARQELGTALTTHGLLPPVEYRRTLPQLSLRDADLRWAGEALARGLPQHLVVRALAATRQEAHDPQSSLRYATRVLSQALRLSLRIAPGAAAATALRALSVATSLPVTLLRLTLGIVRSLGRGR